MTNSSNDTDIWTGGNQLEFNYYTYTAMGLGFIIVAVFVYFFIIIMLKARTARKQGVQILPLVAIAFMFLHFALVRLFMNYNEFHLFAFGSEDIVSYKLGVIFGYLFFIFFNFVTEMILKKSKYMITIFSSAVCIYGTVFINTIPDLRIYTQLTLPILAILLTFNYSIILVIKTTGNIRRKMGFTLFVIVLSLFFYVLDTGLGQTFFLLTRDSSALIARTGLLVSGILLGVTLNSFETFTELDWPSKLKDLFIINKSGIMLYHFSFSEQERVHNPQLISAGLSGVKTFIAEIIKSKNDLKIVDHQDLKLIFEYGNNIIIVLLVSANLHIYHVKLAHLRNQFEIFFQETLAHWDYNLDHFLPTKHLVKQVFEVQDEKEFGQISKVNPLTRRFFILACIILSIGVCNGFGIYFLNFTSWSLILTDNWSLVTLILIAITLCVFIPLWYNFQIFRKSNALKSNIKGASNKMLILLFICIVISSIGLHIYLLYANVLWSAIVFVTGIIEFLLFMILGINLIERLEKLKEL